MCGLQLTTTIHEHGLRPHPLSFCLYPFLSSHIHDPTNIITSLLPRSHLYTSSFILPRLHHEHDRGSFPHHVHDHGFIVTLPKGFAACWSPTPSVIFDLPIILETWKFPPSCNCLTFSSQRRG